MINDRCAGHPHRSADVPLDGIEKDLVSALLGSLARPDAVVEEIVAGPLFIAVVARGRMGISSLLGARPRDGEKDLAGKAVGMKAARVAEYLLGPSPYAVCLAMAALNSAVTPDPSSLREDDRPADALIADLGRGKNVGLVGEFPFTEALREKVGALHLFELRDAPGALPRERWDQVLPGLDVLAVTGTALLTRQMGYFLTGAERAVKIILGPTTPFSPVLFRFGADYLSGSMVTDHRRVAEGIRAGVSFRAIKKNGGIRFVQLRKEDL